MVILSDGHIVRWSFCQMVILSDGHFAKPDLAFGRMDTLFVDKKPHKMTCEWNDSGPNASLQNDKLKISWQNGMITKSSFLKMPAWKVTNEHAAKLLVGKMALQQKAE